MIAFGTNYVYTTVDANGASEVLELTNLGTAGSPIGGVTALAYGTRDNVNALLAGTAGSGTTGNLYLSTTGGAGSLTQLTAYAGGTPSSVVFDNRTLAHFYVADTASLWGTNTTGASFTDLTSNVTALNIVRPTSSSSFPTTASTRSWSAASAMSSTARTPGGGRQRPGRQPGELAHLRLRAAQHHREPDRLQSRRRRAGPEPVRRGAWLLYDVTAYFPSALVLRFGLADNDSAPPASFLTNGNYAYASLEKVGSGTLTISGTTGYTGSTSVRPASSWPTAISAARAACSSGRSRR